MLINLVEVMAMYILLNIDKISIQNNTYILLSRDKNSIQKIMQGLKRADVNESISYSQDDYPLGQHPGARFAQCTIFSFLFSLCLVKQKHIYFYCVWEKNQNNCNISAVFHQNFVKLDCWIDNIEIPLRHHSGGSYQIG